MKNNTTINEQDARLFLVTDDITEAVNLIREKSIEQYGLKPENKVKPFSWLFEKK
jgi:hypothetical protein